MAAAIKTKSTIYKMKFIEDPHTKTNLRLA
jgi:hypothetical protein